ncbi:glycosyl hydrolase family 18 protein [Aeromonas encheleia]|uniref:Glycosyl hydrolase family 18 protein n=1 Tax=Aeromonas encheleia TaxID=73010 RepID=A0AAE9SDL7_9GAMM|nr:glycosyl hydrolase family 18 protein [Aeromonas encheleia]USV59528.1 glycosyl hydrolase family 18 protein [Aeromonas encheleia]
MLVALAAMPAWAQAAYPAYQSGTAYKAGDVVSNVGNLYECKEFPYSGWCGASPYHYAPGVGTVWADAWKPFSDGGTAPGLGLAISSPAVGNAFNEGEPVALAVTLSGDSSALVKVEYLIDGTQVALSSAAPWSASWVASGVGPHQLKSRALDKDGKLLSEADVSFAVSAVVAPEAPKASISSPAAGARLTLGRAATVTADVTDANNDVARVELYVNGQKVGEDGSAPWQLNWTPQSKGVAGLKLVATDKANLVGESAQIDVTVEEAALPPTGGNLSCDIRQIYRADGSECMGDDHARRVIGYFTSWRTGKNGLPAYLVNDIPWDKITHINYAFAAVDEQSHLIKVDAAATKLTWEGVPGAEMDPEFAYKGHLNLLSKYKKQYPDVKTLISVGGWADTRGFYTATTKGDCSVNTAGINAFADSAVGFIRQYGFDGVDVDYEYPTSMKDAGNPNDFPLSNQCRAKLFANYEVLMKTLRSRLDSAGTEDGRKYMLTIASPASAYLLRGMENFQVTQYLDYVNLMTYDFHGAWNNFVAHNAALFDNKADPELAQWGVYSQAQYGAIGYLNAAWSAHYFRGALAAGKINIGVPYYTRGWQGVTGGTHGLNGKAALPSQSNCQPGTGGSTIPCGNGAVGIDNIWHDLDKNGNEVGAGAVPMWHAKNLEHAASLGITTLPSYGQAWGLDPNNPADVIQGKYVRYYDDKAQAPWLWNEEKKVFLSTEDEESMGKKLDYIVKRGLGGVMFWEMAGDYAFDPARNEYVMGSTLTSLAYDKFRTASQPNLKQNDLPAPAAQLDIGVSLSGFKEGDSNYPINPTLKLTNKSTQTIPGGTRIEFLVPTSTSDTITDQSGMGLKVVESGGNQNSDGIASEKDFHKVAMTLPSWKAWAPGTEVEVAMTYYLPAAGVPSGIRLVSGSQTIGLKADFPALAEAVLGSGGGGTSCSAQSVNPASYPAYPSWPQGDHANANDRLTNGKAVWQANWWTSSEPKAGDGSWKLVCNY